MVTRTTDDVSALQRKKALVDFEFLEKKTGIRTEMMVALTCLNGERIDPQNRELLFIFRHSFFCTAL